MDGIFQDNYNYTFFDFLAEHIEKGALSLTDLNVSLDAVKNNQQNIEKSYFSDLIKIEKTHRKKKFLQIFLQKC